MIIKVMLVLVVFSFSFVKCSKTSPPYRKGPPSSPYCNAYRATRRFFGAGTEVAQLTLPITASKVLSSAP